MKTTRQQLKDVLNNVEESIGGRREESRHNLSPVPTVRDIGRRANRTLGQIDIDRILPDPDQPRTEFDDEAIQQLAASLRDRGQLSPIRVRWSERHNSWLIISGERRWRAAKRAGLKMMNCHFQEQTMSPTEVLEEQLIENLLRQDLRPVEEAESYQKLMQINDWNGKQLAEALNISPTRVSRALSLLKLPHEMRVRIDSGEVSARAGYELSRTPSSELPKQPTAERITIQSAAKIARSKSPRKERGVQQTFYADNGWQVVVRCPRRGTYVEVEQALAVALEEVKLRIQNRVSL